MLTVGIDVTNLFWPVSTGVHRYGSGLLEGLSCILDINDVYVAMLDWNVEEYRGRQVPKNEGFMEYRGAAPLPALNTRAIEAPEQMSSLFSRISNKGVHTVRKLLARYFYHSPDLLKGIDVFHAWHLYPRQGAARNTVMLHDAYQLLYPDMFSPTMVARQIKGLEFAKNVARIVLVPSQYTADVIADEFGVDNSKIRVVYHGLSASFRVIKEHAEIQPVLSRYSIFDSPYILSVGYLDPRKNVVGHLRAFESLAKESQFKELKLVLVGPSDARTSPILSEIQSSAFRDRVIITGYVSENELPVLYSQAKAFIYCSHYEGFGLPIIEAMACGVPVVTSNRTCLPEVAGKAATIVDPDSPTAITDALAEILMSATKREHMSQAGLERAAEFTWEKAARNHVAAYRECYNG